MSSCSFEWNNHTTKKPVRPESLQSHGWLENKNENINHWNMNGSTNGKNEALENFKATSADKKLSKHTVLTTSW